MLIVTVRLSLIIDVVCDNKLYGVNISSYLLLDLGWDDFLFYSKRSYLDPLSTFGFKSVVNKKSPEMSGFV